MNKRFNLVMAVVLFLSSFLPGGAIGLPRTAYAYDPPPPAIGFQTPNDRAINDTSTATSTPTPGDLSPTAEQMRVQQAMEMTLAKYLDYWGPRYQVAPVEVRVIGDWAHGVAAWQSQERTFKTSINLLAHRLHDGQWQVVMPDNEEVFLQWVTAAPGQLLSASVKSQLRAQAAEAATLRPPTASPMVPPPATERTPAQTPIALLQPTPTPTPVSPIKVNVEDELDRLVPPTPTFVNLLTKRNFSGIYHPAEGPGSFVSEDATLAAMKALTAERFLGLPFADASEFVAAGWLYNGGSYHGGIDWMLDYNTEIYAAADGVAMVTEQPDDGSHYAYGIFVYIKHNNGYYTLYAHLNRGASGIVVYPASQRWNQDYANWTPVQKGQLIGYVGSTGTTSNHLHFEARTGPYSNPDSRVDPYGIYGQAVSYPPRVTITPNSNYLWINNPPSFAGSSNDTTPPDGDFSTPSENQVITNGTVYISGWASDGGSGFQKAHFTATWNGASWRQISPDFTSSPFGFNWDMCAAGVPDGQITLGLDIWDNAGNQANSPHGVRHFTKSYNCSPPPPSCNPNADQVALYVDANYGGQCVVKGIGQYSNPSAIGLPNDSISSVKVGGNVRAVLCKDDNYGGGCETFNGDDPDLSNNSIGNDQVSSAKVEPRTSLPAAPTLLSPSNEAPINEGTSINLSWTATGDQYRGEIWGGPGGTLTFGPQSGTSINIGAQWAGYTYSWHIKAINSAGESAWSETRTFRVKLAAPTNLTGTPTSCTQFNLTWTDNSGNEEGYKIYWYGYEMDQVGANATSYQGVQSGGETGLYSVRAYRGSSESDSSAEIAVTTPSCATPPSPPTLQSPGNGSVFDESQSVTLCWSATGSEYYGEVWGGPAGTSTFGWQADTCKTIGAQWAGYTYSWHVKAQNSAGPSGWSSTWTFTVRPNAPSGLVAQAVACNQVNLSWTDNSGNEEGYRIYRDGVSISTVSANVTNYEDTGVGENSSHSYYIKAFRGSIESAASGTVPVSVPVCPPADSEDPVVTWVSPVGNEQTYAVEDETVQLQAEATDNVGVARVRFFRWDAVNLQIVEIGDDYTDPYQRDFDCSILNYGWNETLVEAYDAAGNVSEWQSIWLYRLSPAPDLEPYALPGYPYPVVPSSITGTHEVNLLYADQPTYFDWYFANTGTATATDTFHVELWVDDILYVRYPFSDFGAGWASGFEDWSEGIATPGWHVVSLITDPDDTVIESDESNNHWYEYFYWAPSAPFADDMENGLNGWTATGLWHQVDETNPYSESYSPTHSWWYGQDSTGNYDTGLPNAGDLTSPPVYIPTTGYYLRFKYLYETEMQGPDWDQRWVQISVDGGPFMNALQLYDDLMFGWHQSPPMDLSGYAGHAIQVRFHFDSLDDYANAYRGWYIDDVDISATPPPTCADPYEPNNTYQQATAIAYGNSRTADLCPNGDYDFYRFTGAAGDKVVVDIDARINGSWLDSYIYLLDSDGTTILALNDDDFVSLDSQLGFNLPHDGYYYIKVKSWSHPSTGSPDHYYTLHLLTDDTSPTAQMASPLNGNYLVSTTTMITVTATDNHAVQRVEFLWHDGNWADPDWQWLGADWYGSDGWSWNLDTGSVPEQSGAAVYIWAFDWVGNWVGAASWDLTLDRTAPQTAISIDLPYGEAQFRDFWVSWWESQDNLSGITSYDLQYRDGAAGTWTNWLLNTTEVYTRFVGLDNHTYYFRVRARDLAGNQSVYTSGNGDAQHSIDICDISPDAYEVDNGAGSASWITTDGVAQTHNMHGADDQDWVKFSATAGITYTLRTTDIGGYADTVLYLYGTNGTTLIDYNDDYGEMGYSSRIDWKPNVSGTYYAQVKHWDPWAYGCTTAYSISVIGAPGNDNHYVYLPLVLRSPSAVTVLSQQQRVPYGPHAR
ncbi:MAG: Ig-like domain-containing protein [Anaerolineae bacterium]|jgi:murein DD-endopeptidase MepM/ murein hydrolase activator NlpD|nr:Ig-like domain-containing protein [Anaerolineae bacterium]